jgi:hypothetical protein
MTLPHGDATLRCELDGKVMAPLVREFLSLCKWSVR